MVSRPVPLSETLAHVAVLCVAMIACVFASLVAYTYIQGDAEKICRPPARTGAPLHVCSQPFDPHTPPRMRDGHKIVNQSELVIWGEAALHVCSKGTTDQSFLRRDDCDGCLCPSGSLWMHYKDPRFFGNGEYCVPEKQWKDCISRWSCCKNKPNYCWDFIFDGARQDPKSEDYCVVVDTCSQHMACYSMIVRRRRWELISELRPTSDIRHQHEITVGVPRVQMQHVNKTLNMNSEIRGWGMPSSVLQLIKVTPTTAPQEWQEEDIVPIERRLKGGKRHKIWQLVSYYTITAKGMSGESACARERCSAFQAAMRDVLFMSSFTLDKREACWTSTSTVSAPCV